MKETTLLIILGICLNVANAQKISKSFEMRYITPDTKANGQTDYKGGDEWMDMEERISFLEDYATYGKFFYKVSGLDKKNHYGQRARCLVKKDKTSASARNKERAVYIN